MLRFIQITDIHLLSNKNDRLYDIPIFDLLSSIIDEIKENESSYDFVILSGDLADKGLKSSYLLLSSVLSVLTIPCYWINGNHDNSDILKKTSKKWKLLNDRSFTHKDIHFTLLSTVIKDEDGTNKARGKLEKHELQFLESDLCDHPKMICVIVMHHPPVLSRTWTDERMLKNYNDFFSVIDKYENVKLVVYGHQHQSFQTNRNNVLYYSPPAAAFQFGKTIRWTIERSFSGYGMIEINNLGQISCENKYVNFSN